MSRIQKLLASILPRKWAEAMEAESRAWKARCDDCQQERSLWELGGIRWMVAGSAVDSAAPRFTAHFEVPVYARSALG